MSPFTPPLGLRTIMLLVACAAAPLLTGCAPSGTAALARTTPASTATTPDLPAGPTSVLLHVGDDVAIATLDDTPAARQLAAMLPLRLTLRDTMGQSKIARLPHRLDARNAATSTDPAEAAIYYWPPIGDIAIVYDDLGQTVPLPGLIRLGAVTTGLAAIADAGDSLHVQTNDGSSLRSP